MNKIVSFRLCKLTDRELIERVDVATDNMFKTGIFPPRNIPARPDADYDLLVGELLLRFKEITGLLATFKAPTDEKS